MINYWLHNVILTETMLECDHKMIKIKLQLEPGELCYIEGLANMCTKHTQLMRKYECKTKIFTIIHTYLLLYTILKVKQPNRIYYIIFNLQKNHFYKLPDTALILAHYKKAQGTWLIGDKVRAIRFSNAMRLCGHFSNILPKLHFKEASTKQLYMNWLIIDFFH